MFTNNQQSIIRKIKNQKQLVAELIRFKDNGYPALTMDKTTLFIIFATVTLISFSMFNASAFAQNISQQVIKKTEGNVHENISLGLAVPVGNTTVGLVGTDPDKIAESLSNFTGNVSKGFNNLFNESNK